MERDKKRQEFLGLSLPKREQTRENLTFEPVTTKELLEIRTWNQPALAWNNHSDTLARLNSSEGRFLPKNNLRVVLEDGIFPEYAKEAREMHVVQLIKSIIANPTEWNFVKISDSSWKDGEQSKTIIGTGPRHRFELFVYRGLSFEYISSSADDGRNTSRKSTHGLKIVDSATLQVTQSPTGRRFNLVTTSDSKTLRGLGMICEYLAERTETLSQVFEKLFKIIDAATINGFDTIELYTDLNRPKKYLGGQFVPDVSEQLARFRQQNGSEQELCAKYSSLLKLFDASDAERRGQKIFGEHSMFRSDIVKMGQINHPIVVSLSEFLVRKTTFGDYLCALRHKSGKTS